MQYFLLILFMGYYGSITLFNHTHIFNGATIAHSHPFKSGAGKIPVKHQHTSKEYVNIQLLSAFLALLALLTFFITARRKPAKINELQKNCSNFANLFFAGSNGLRAPPAAGSPPFQ